MQPANTRSVPQCFHTFHLGEVCVCVCEEAWGGYGPETNMLIPVIPKPVNQLFILFFTFSLVHNSP